MLLNIVFRKRILFILLAVVAFLFITSQKAHAQSANFILKSESANISEGQEIIVEIYAKSDVPVNAAQLTLEFPTDVFYVEVDNEDYAFDISAQENVDGNKVSIAKGSIRALTGENLFAKIKLKALKDGNLKSLETISPTQIVTSSENSDIYSTTELDAGEKSFSFPKFTFLENLGFLDLLIMAVREFFRILFRF